MALFKLKKACHGKEAGEDVNVTDQRACLLMRSGFINKNLGIMKKFAEKIKKAEQKETAVSEKHNKKETADNKSASGNVSATSKKMMQK